MDEVHVVRSRVEVVILPLLKWHTSIVEVPYDLATVLPFPSLVSLLHSDLIVEQWHSDRWNVTNGSSDISIQAEGISSVDFVSMRNGSAAIHLRVDVPLTRRGLCVVMVSDLDEVPRCSMFLSPSPGACCSTAIAVWTTGHAAVRKTTSFLFCCRPPSSS